MTKYWMAGALAVFILLNAGLGAWNLSGDPSGGKIAMGLFNLGAGAFCAIVLGKIVADWRWL